MVIHHEDFNQGKYINFSKGGHTISKKQLGDFSVLFHHQFRRTEISEYPVFYCLK